MRQRFEGKNVVITGASSGIGAALARAFAASVGAGEGGRLIPDSPIPARRTALRSAANANNDSDEFEQ